MYDLPDTEHNPIFGNNYYGSNDCENPNKHDNRWETKETNTRGKNPNAKEKYKPKISAKKVP